MYLFIYFVGLLFISIQKVVMKKLSIVSMFVVIPFYYYDFFIEYLVHYINYIIHF